MCCVFFFKQKTAYDVRISDWSSDVCSSDLHDRQRRLAGVGVARVDDARVVVGEQRRRLVAVALLDRLQEAVGIAELRGCGRRGKDRRGGKQRKGCEADLRAARHGWTIDRKSTRLNSSQQCADRMPYFD